MFRKGIYLGTSVLLSFGLAQQSSAQDDYFTRAQQSQYEHRLYLSIPFSIGNKIKHRKPIKYGYAFNFKSQAGMHDRFRFQSWDHRASLLNVQFSPQRSNSIQIAGLPLFQFDRNGLYLDDKMKERDGKMGSKAILGLVGAVGLLGLAVATSGEEEEEPCDPAYIGNRTIIVFGIQVCKASDL